MLNDPLANVLNNLVNASRIGKQSCKAKPYSEIIKKVLDILQEKKYIGKVEVVDEGQGKTIEITIVQKINKCGAIKPRFSVKKGDYERFEKRYLPAKDFGLIIVSTSQGIMTHIEAKDKGLGGKLLAYVY